MSFIYKYTTKWLKYNTQEYHNFIVQDVRFIFKNSPYFRKLTNTVSDIGHRGTIMIEGIGIKTPLQYN